MFKETLSERNSNPKYYESIQCEAQGCTERHDLLFHRYSETFMCTNHVNQLMAEASKEENVGREYDEDKADEDRLEFLLQEREA